LSEFKERFGGFKFGEAVELVCGLKRLEQCKEKILAMMDEARELKLWDMVTLVKDMAEIEVCREERKLRRDTPKLRVSESDRFSGRVLNTRHFLVFPSGRLL